MQNQTQLVRSAINLFIIVAVSISIFQQLMNVSQKPIAARSVTTPTGESVPLEPTGPKLQGIRIQSSDKFQTPLKELLAKKQLNIEIVQYEFQGNEYWVSMIANWGHMVLIFFFMSKHKSETDEGKKKKIMIVGALAVVAWFYFSPQLKPQRFAVEVNGSKVYEKDYLIEEEVASALEEYEFQIDDLRDTQGAKVDTEPVDAWEQKQQEQRAPRVQEPVMQEEEVF